MANARAIVKRRKAVRNVRKITRTMQLIATARYQQAYNRAVAARPYTDKIAELVTQVTGATEGISHPLLRTESVAGRRALLVLTSNRGQCGGYNSRILRVAQTTLEGLAQRGEKTDLHLFGKKGVSYYRFLGQEMASTDTASYERPTFDEVERVANRFLKAFVEEQIDAVQVVYMRFISAGRQHPEVITLLPLQQETSDASEADVPAKPHAAVPYEFTPPPEQLLADLLPQTVKVRLFQCFIDAAVSEQIARMIAMKAATEAANDMIKSLSRQYNRARQSQITLELLDIMGGAEALK